MDLNTILAVSSNFKGPKKKLTRAERNRMEMERLEQARIQAELEAQRAIEEEMRRLEMERRSAMEKEKRETAEQALRVEQLTSTNLLIRNTLDLSWARDRKEKQDFERDQYLKCDGLPDPTNPSQMSTYLHLWKKICYRDVTVEELQRRTSEITSLLEVLGDLVDDPFDATDTLIDNWKWIRTQCREQQQESLDMATYRLLRDINARMNRPDIQTADFTINDENFVLCLWLPVKLATPMHNPRAPAKKRLETNFPETRLNILFPTALDAKDIVIRAIYEKYDHLSDDCDTYNKPEMVDEINKDLLQSTCREWYSKMKYKWDNYKGDVGALERTVKSGDLSEETAEDDSFEFEDCEIPPSVPYKKLDPTASQYVINLEGKEHPKENDAASGEAKDATSEGDAKTQENGPPEGEAKREQSDANAGGKQVKRKKPGAKSYEHLLDETPMKFKNVSFENVKTPEEKAAKKAAKKAEKKGKKKEAKASSDEEKVKSAEETPPKRATSKEKQEDAKPASSEASLEKKTKKKDAAKEEVTDGDTKKEPKKKGKKETKDSDSEKSQEEGEGKKAKKGKKPSGDESPEKPEKVKKPKEPKEPKDDAGEKKDKKQKKGKKKDDLQEDASTISPERKGLEDEDEIRSIDSDGEDKGKKRSKKPFKTVSFTTSMMQKGLPRSTSGPFDSDSLQRSKTSVASRESAVSDQSELSEESKLGLIDSSVDFTPKISKSRGRGQKASRKSRAKIKTKSSLSTVDEFSEESIDTDKPPQKLKEKKEKKAKKRGPKSEGDVSQTFPPSLLDVSPKPSREIKEEKQEKTKKKGKKKTEAVEAPVQEVDSVIDQIQKMKAAAELKMAPTTSAEAEQQPAEAEGKKMKGKKGKREKKTAPEPQGRKMSAAERSRLEAEKAEQARIQAELDAKNAEEEERRRQEEERKQGREKEKREFAEQQLRVEQLGNSTNLIKNMLEANWNTNAREKIDLEWEQYLKCDGLPDPTKPAEINTYIHLWEQTLNDVSVEEVKRRTNEIIALLDVLQGFIDDPFDAPNSLVADWKWVRNLCRKHQAENLDMATYRLLRDIDSRLNRIDIPTADFHIHEDNFNLSLWLYVQLATPMYNPRAPVRKRLEIEFSKSFTVLFPSELDAKCMAIRTTYLRYDHLSDSCATYDRPTTPSEIGQDLYEAVVEEWHQKMWYKWEHRKPPPKKMVEDSEGNLIEVAEPEPVIERDELPPPVPWQKLEVTASKYGVDAETELYEKVHNKLCVEVPDKVLNLRKFLVIGGVYCIDLFYQPPQPHDLVAFDIRITALQVPKKLCEVPFYVAPEASADSEGKRPPEELEEELKRQEAELDKLMLVTLTLPDHVMFLDLPVVCHWHKKRKIWMTADVYDLKHIEEKNYMTFRTGRFGHFALAVNRYLNFPLQAWELKPEPDGSVTFQITCAILMVEFKIKDNRICLTQLQNSPNNALQDVVGIYYKLPKLIRILQTGGVDLFPACDAFCYVEGACEKHWPTERHLYYCMALLSPSYNFAWSRWNNQAGRRNFVLQMREYKLNSTKQKNHSMLLVTPLKATLIETTEVSPVFNDTPTEGMKFYADLYHLMKGTSTMATRNKVLNGSPDVAKTLSDLLIMTRVASFS